MSDNNKVLVRNARDQDLPAVVEINAEALSTHGIAESPETFPLRLRAFPDGFVILVAENEVAGYGCSEKWLTEHEPGPGEGTLVDHDPDGRIFHITGIAVRMKYQERGYHLLILDRLLAIAHGDVCKKVIVETAHAQDLYRERGFEVVRTRTKGGTSLDVMSLDLKSIGNKP